MSAPAAELIVAPDGTLRHIHSPETVRISNEISRIRITRASHVEPDADNNWWVDLSPVGGPRLGPYPFDERSRALQDEVDWLREHDIPVPEKI